MKRLAQIVALVVVALLSACGNKEVVRETEPIYTPRYAQGFSIERDKASGELLLCVKNPWQGADNVIYYSTLNSDKPAERIVAMSSSYVAMLDAIGCVERIVGISGCRFISAQGHDGGGGVSRHPPRCDRQGDGIHLLRHRRQASP